LDEVKNSELGWTYAFIDSTGIFLKIGKTILNIEERYQYIKACVPYSKLEFSFYFAINDANLELKLHEYFSQYHANNRQDYNPKIIDINDYYSVASYFTKREMDKVLSSRKNKKSKITFTKTKIELFKFPSKISQSNTLSILVKNFAKKGLVVTVI
jgi:hypothetical protein